MFLERDEMKFAILYTLKRYVEPATMPQLSEVLTWDNKVMGYFDLAIMLNELIEDEYIERTHYRGVEAFFMSEKGKDTNSFFFERIPASIRRHIEDTVATMKYQEQVDPHAIKSEILPVAPQQYMASLQMLDGGSPLLELQIFAGSKAEAEHTAKALKQQAADIYKDLIHRIGGTDRSHFDTSADEDK